MTYSSERSDHDPVECATFCRASSYPPNRETLSLLCDQRLSECEGLWPVSRAFLESRVHVGGKRTEISSNRFSRRRGRVVTHPWTFSTGSLACPALEPALWRTRTKLRNRFLRNNPIELEPTLQEHHKPNSPCELAVRLRSPTPIVHRCSKPSKDDLCGP